MSRHIVSVDLGQSIDPTAVAVLEVRTRQDIVDEQYADPPGPKVPREWFGEDGWVKHRNRVHRIDVRHLERLPLRMPYPEQIQHIQTLLRRSPLTLDTDLVLDQTGVGRPVIDMFRQVGLRPVGVTITAGDSETEGFSHSHEYRVAKTLLVSRLQSLLHGGELKISTKLKEAEVLGWELQDFRASVTDTGYWRFGARSGKHDDLVLAVAIGCWWACREVPVYHLWRNILPLPPRGGNKSSDCVSGTWG